MLIPTKHSGYQRDGRRLYPGGKSSSAPAPDPALVAAQIKSMGIQDSVIEQILGNSRDLAPIQRAQMQFGLDTSRKAYEQSQEDRAFALGKRDKLSTVQDGMATEAATFNTEDKRNELAGQAMGDVNQAAANAREQSARNLSRMGVNPNSGRALAMNNQIEMAQAAALAGAGNNARTSARAEGRALTDRVSNAFSGYPAMGSQSTGAGAGFGANGLTLANSGLAGLNGGLTAAGTAAGQMGSNATSMYGAQGQFNLANQQLANAPDPLMQMAGAAAGTFMRSDVRHKTRISGLRPGKALAMVAAMPVSEWQYKPQSDAADGGKRHVGPMAQDVRRIAGDRVAPGGTAIDLVSMNGINLAATQDLNNKVEQLTRVVNRLAGRGGLRREQPHG